MQGFAEWWSRVGFFIALLVMHDLAAVIVYDAIAWFRSTPTVSAYIRHSWMAWPVAIMATITVGLIITGHFVTEKLPGN